VQQHLKTLGIEKTAELEVDSSGNVRGKKPVSGRLSKIENTIEKSVLWPHSKLDPKYVANNLTYDAIDFPLLVAGELSIVLNPTTTKEEADFRCKLVRELSYCVRVCHWATARQFHSAILTEVERNERKWSEDSFLNLMTSTLAAQAQLQASQALQVNTGNSNRPRYTDNIYANRGPRKRRYMSRGQAPQQDNVKSHLFCQAFNQGTCPINKDHMGMYRNENVLLEHICAHCWLSANEVARHPDRECAKYKASGSV
jgi:hypothetical protein